MIVETVLILSLILLLSFLILKKYDDVWLQNQFDEANKEFAQGISEDTQRAVKQMQLIFKNFGISVNDIKSIDWNLKLENEMNNWLDELKDDGFGEDWIDKENLK